LFEQGTVYLLAGRHYYFIISDPSLDPGNVVAVNMTTFRGFGSEDHSCVLSEGEHQIIRHKSWIKYEKAEVTSLKMLNHRYAVNAISEVVSEKCRSVVMRRILAGAAASGMTPKKVRVILERQGLI
jgi:adenylyl- and sulfurtransferase ThiI